MQAIAREQLLPKTADIRGFLGEIMRDLRGFASLDSSTGPVADGSAAASEEQKLLASNFTLEVGKSTAPSRAGKGGVRA